MVVAALTATSARAQHYSTERPNQYDLLRATDLRDLCLAEVTRDSCHGQVSGYVEMYVTMAEADPDTRAFCRPDYMTAEQARRVYVDWTDRHRDELADVPAAIAFLAALREAFPCPSG